MDAALKACIIGIERISEIQERTVPRENLSEDRILEVLAEERLVRIAFQDGPSAYLIPLGYVWLRGALYGVTEAGRKTELAEVNANVTFQVDTSLRTGLWEWQSVMGTGRFEIVASGEEKQQAIAALQAVIAEAPGWWRREQGPKIAAGAMLVWKVVPARMDGCRYRAPDDVS